MYSIKPMRNSKDTLPESDYVFRVARWFSMGKIVFQSTLIGVLKQYVVHPTEFEAPEEANDVRTGRPFAMDPFQSPPLVIVILFHATVTTVALENEGLRRRMVTGVTATCIVLLG